jgi:hypothetical protein
VFNMVEGVVCVQYSGRCSVFNVVEGVGVRVCVTGVCDWCV